MNKTATVEVLDHVWVFSENTIAEDALRRSNQLAVSFYLVETVKDAKPATKRAANVLLGPYFADVTSALVSIDGETNSELVNSLFEPQGWVDFLAPLWFAGRDVEITKLWETAKSVNTQWYPDNPTEGVSGNALAVVAQTESALTEQSVEQGDQVPYLTEEIVSASTELTNTAEANAKKKARSGR